VPASAALPHASAPDLRRFGTIAACSPELRRAERRGGGRCRSSGAPPSDGRAGECRRRDFGEPSGVAAVAAELRRTERRGRGRRRNSGELSGVAAVDAGTPASRSVRRRSMPEFRRAERRGGGRCRSSGELSGVAAIDAGTPAPGRADGGWRAAGRCRRNSGATSRRAAQLAVRTV